MKKAKINKEMSINEVLRRYPKTAFVFIDYGLHCVGCPMAEIGKKGEREGLETIEEAANLHRIDLKKFLKDLNSGR